MRLPRALNRKVMRMFVEQYQLNMDEAELPLEEYPTLGALFTRAVKPGTHTIDEREGVAVSPADGHVLNSGRIERGRLVQCKGYDFEVADLLDNPEYIERFQGGSWCTVYLSPRDYHRVHHPVEGKITCSHYITGALWPVNAAAVQNVERLFCVNERVVTYVESPMGLVATIMVGATSVGHITMAYDDKVVANKGNPSEVKRYEEGIEVKRADEMGTFHLGSTAVVLFANPEVKLEELTDGQPIRIGTPIASLTPSA
jgi:phosphatidylserine decarboxylase